MAAGDTIVSTVRPYLRAVAYAQESPNTLIASTGFATLSPDGEIHPNFLPYALVAGPFISLVEAKSVGVSYPAIAPSVLGSMKIAVPPRSTQAEIVDHVSARTRTSDELEVRIQSGIDRLSEYRSALISAAVTGGIDVRKGIE